MHVPLAFRSCSRQSDGCPFPHVLLINSFTPPQFRDGEYTSRNCSTQLIHFSAYPCPPPHTIRRGICLDQFHVFLPVPAFPPAGTPSVPCELLKARLCVSTKTLQNWTQQIEERNISPWRNIYLRHSPKFTWRGFCLSQLVFYHKLLKTNQTGSFPAPIYPSASILVFLVAVRFPHQSI